MPFVAMVAWFVLATVAGQRWNPFSFSLQYLAPLAVFGFFLVLYRAPARVGDSAMAASVLVILSLAVDLCWSALPRLYEADWGAGLPWTFGISWLVANVLEPAAWLAFFVTFVRGPGLPLSQASRRAAAWLALVLTLRGVRPILEVARIFLPSRFFPRRYHLYPWNGIGWSSFDILHYLLLLIFAVAIWRMRPAADRP